MCAFFFKDFGKKAQDLLSDDFSYKRKLKIRLPTPNGVTWTTDGELSNKGVLARLSAKYKHSSGISLDALEFKTDGRLLGEASLDVDPRLKLWVSAEDGRQDAGKPIKSHGKLGFEYVNPKSVTMEGDVDVVNGPTVSGSAVFSVKGLLVGVDASYNTQFDDKDQKPEFLDYNAAVGMKGSTWETSLRTYNKMSLIQLGVYTKATPNASFATTFDYQLDKNAQALTMGGSYQLDAHTKVAGKITSAGTLGLAYKQSVSPVATLLLAAEVDTKDWASDTHKFGIGVTLSG